MTTYLDFEKPVAALEARISELQETADETELDASAEIGKLRGKADKMLSDTYAKLTAWQKTQVARHPERPHFKHYVAGLFDQFLPLGGGSSICRRSSNSGRICADGQAARDRDRP